MFLAILLASGAAQGAAHDALAGIDGIEVIDGLDALQADDFVRVARPFLTEHCARCHGGEDPQAGLDLAGVEGAAAVGADTELWDWLREQVDTRAMPPAGETAPDPADRDAFLDWLDRELMAAGVDLVAPSPDEIDPGRPVLRRLSNAEYTNSIRDLFGIDFPAERFLPADPVGHGFDVVGEAQQFSDAHFEVYLEAAEWVASGAFAAPVSGPPPTTRVGPEALDGDGRERSGDWFMSTRGQAGATFPMARAGAYRVRAKVLGFQAGPEVTRMAFVVDGRVCEKVHDVPATPDAPMIVEERLRLERDARVEVRFINDYYDPKNEDPAQRDRNFALRWIEVHGPVDEATTPAFQRALFERHPVALGPTREASMLAELVRRVLRRPPLADELARLAAVLPNGEALEARMQRALVALLASPSFLFKVEAGGAGSTDAEASAPGDVRALTDHELAVRLSYFLWSSTPDVVLDDLADAGRLHDSAVLAEQLDRMLDDERARAFSEGFALQWLQLRPLTDWTVDKERYPEFNGRLRRAMLEETLRVFLDDLRQGASLWDLVDGTSTLVDGRLAQHYGLEQPPGGFSAGWHRVELAETQRRGLLGHASVLTITSEPTRTSPVKRGKWVLEVLFGDPPPPPPPGTGSLDDGAGKDKGLPLRERLELHRGDPDCAACHARMDPLGFGLEVFDPIGREVRAGDGDTPADTRGELPDGRVFDGPVELVRILRADDRFLRNVCERLLVYALGRRLERSDRYTVQHVLGRLDPERPTLRQALGAIVGSRAFTHIRIQR